MRRRAGASPDSAGLPAPRALLLLLLALAVTRCDRGDAPLQPVYRLTDELEPPLDQVPVHCDVGAVFRPTIGCVAYVPTGVVSVPRSSGNALHVPLTIPEGIDAELVVVEPKVRGPGERWRRAPFEVLTNPPSRNTTVTVPVPRPVKGDRVDVEVDIRPVPPDHQARVTRPLRIGRGAQLSVALGLDQLGVQVGASPVTFRVYAEVEGRSTRLLEETLEPHVAKAWQERTIDLARFAGSSVRFRLTTDVVPGGVGGVPAFSFPLWGSGQVIEPGARDGRRNVILISIDTLRGDQLGGTLSGIPLMPKLDARAQQGTRFTDAFATYPSTTASHMTMFTGLYPATHGMIFPTGHLSADIVTLPEIFAEHGYATAAVTEDAMLSAHVGFVRGFDWYREVKGKQGKLLWVNTGEMEQTFDAGLTWLREHRDERFFLFLHTYEVHEPYDPPPEHDLFKTWTREGVEVPIDDGTPAFERDRHLYAGEVHFADARLDQLFDEIDALGLLDDSIVVVTGDHGDEFGEHGMTGHARTVYDEVLHVPLVLLAPRLVPAGKRIDTPVSLIDLAPTLLDLTRLPIPRDTAGISLVPLLRGEPFPKMRVLYAEAPKWGPNSSHRVAARTAGFKWIGSDDPRAMQVFDLTSDPGEQNPLDDPELLAAGKTLEAIYRRGIAQARRNEHDAKPGRPAKKPDLDDATIEKLKALGYVD